jgi:hypothetical protein
MLPPPPPSCRRRRQAAAAAVAKLPPPPRRREAAPCIPQLVKYHAKKKYVRNAKILYDLKIFASKDFFSSSVLFLRRSLAPRQEGLLTRDWPKKSANHGSWRLLPPASPMGWWRPNQVHPPHTHIMGGDACAWFGRPTRPGRVIG